MTNPIVNFFGESEQLHAVKHLGSREAAKSHARPESVFPVRRVEPSLRSFCATRGGCARVCALAEEKVSGSGRLAPAKDKDSHKVIIRKENRHTVQFTKQPEPLLH